MSIITLLIWLILACVFVWAARAILTAFGIGDPIRTVVYVVLVLILVLLIVGRLGGLDGGLRL